MFKWLSNFVQSRKPIMEYLGAHRSIIDDYRNYYRSSPCGCWSQAVGTFGGIMDEIWEFNPDHTGKIVETGPFGDVRSETLFEWKEVADFTIACKVTKWAFEDDEDQTREIENEEASPEEWDIIRYNFKMSRTDCGSSIAMYQVSDDGTFLKGFWHSAEPLTSNGKLSSQ